MTRRIRRATAPALGLVAFFGLWEALVRLFAVKPFVLPGPWRILRTLGADPGFFWREGLVTARTAAAGLAIGLLLALAAAVPMARSRSVERAVQPVALFIQVIPLVVYAPAFVIWMKPGLRPMVAVSALVCFVPLLYNLVAGLRAADRDTCDLLRSVGASRWEVLRHVEIPSALPHLFAGLRTAVGLALIGAVFSEWFALVSHGLGRQIQRGMAIPGGAQLIWGCAFALALLGSVSLAIVTLFERLVVRGAASERG